MQAIELPLSKLRRRLSARAINQAAVAGLVESIREIGIINPIRVRPSRIYEDAISTDGWEITAGCHRHEAAKQIGLETVPCIVVSDDDLHAELAMIDENLCRAELSPSVRALQTARRKEIYEELHPEAKAGVAGANARWHADEKFTSAFSSDVAEKTGRTQRAVQLDTERGEKVIEEALNLIRGTSLDTGVYLDKLKRLTPNDQVTAVERDLLAERRRLREAKAAKETKLAPEPLSDFEAEEKQYAALVSAWNRSGTGARERFREYIDTPVFDRGAAA